MPVLATPVRNKYSHISYLLFCDQTGEATALDPFDVELTLRMAEERGLRITQILSTHEHWDHAGRNEQVRAETGAKVLGSKWAAGVIEGLDVMLVEGDRVEVGRSLELQVIETPGHTMTHISLLGNEAGRPFLLCGDTLFGAGVGNSLYGGHAPTLFRTVQKLCSTLPDDTLLFPGHDYLARNLEFALSVEPDNNVAMELRDELPGNGSELRFTTLSEELQINPFMRLKSPQIRSSLELNDQPLDETIFLDLRRRRDEW